jgi:hypothetical protein
VSVAADTRFNLLTEGLCANANLPSKSLRLHQKLGRNRSRALEGLPFSHWRPLASFNYDIVARYACGSPF